MRGGAAGLGVRGGKGGVDTTDPTPDWRYFRRSHDGSTGVTQPVYPAGICSLASGGSIGFNTLQGILPANDAGLYLYAIPELFPKPGRIRRLQQFYAGSTGPAATNRFRMGIYSNAGPGNPYPLDLLFDSGFLNGGIVGQATGVVSATCDVAVGPAALVWFTFSCHPDSVANSCQLHTGAERDWVPFLGTAQDFQQYGGNENAPSLGIGWRHAQSFGALPTRFPSSAPVVIPQRASGGPGTVPVIWFGFQEV